MSQKILCEIVDIEKKYFNPLRNAKSYLLHKTNHFFASRQTVIHSRVKIVLKLYFMHIWLVVRLFNIYMIKAGVCVFVNTRMLER